MKNIGLLWGFLSLFMWGSCGDDDSYKDNQPELKGNGRIELALTGRIGTSVGETLTDYVDALNLFLFRENTGGEYILFRTLTFNKAELEGLSLSDRETEPGFTEMQQIILDSVPLAHYKIVGLGNALSASGQPLAQVALEGVTLGNRMEEVLAAIAAYEQSPRLFWGITGDLAVGGEEAALPVLRMYRKVAMFSLTLLKIPDVVDKIDMEFGNTYGTFNMAGDFVAGSEIPVMGSTAYEQNVQDSITVNYVMLPTVAGDSTTIDATFYLSGSDKQNVVLPKYVLRPNTITKVTATIDTDQPGNQWKVDVNTLITVNVEWNVDQEPPITI